MEVEGFRERSLNDLKFENGDESLEEREQKLKVYKADEMME